MRFAVVAVPYSWQQMFDACIFRHGSGNNPLPFSKLESVDMIRPQARRLGPTPLLAETDSITQLL